LPDEFGRTFFPARDLGLPNSLAQAARPRADRN